MLVKQIFTGCLSQVTYLIESQGEIAIIDPLREINEYLELAKKVNGKIKYIFETHIHADFVSGHLSLSKATGAPIIYGPNCNTSYPIKLAKDGEKFKLGKLIFELLHTPGHTLESSTYLLKNQNGEDYAIFTGDTLLMGDVGRPDLAQKKNKYNQKEMAGMLYDSLRNKILPLNDNVIIYPAHGAGSACAKNISPEKHDTLGNQKSVNYALNTELSRDEFINQLITELEPPPEYFPMNVKLNLEGYEDVEDILKKRCKKLNPDEFERTFHQNGAIILDVRNQTDFANEHIPESIFIGLDGGFAPWVGSTLGDINQPILLVCPYGREKETITRLSRVGFDNTLGYLNGGLEAWKDFGKKTDSVPIINPSNLKGIINDSVNIIDVRTKSEFEKGHLKNALNIPLNILNQKYNQIPAKRGFLIHCAGGYRSMIANSILKKQGIHTMTDIIGGFAAIKSSGINLSK